MKMWPVPEPPLSPPPLAPETATPKKAASSDKHGKSAGDKADNGLEQVVQVKPDKMPDILKADALKGPLPPPPCPPS